MSAQTEVETKPVRYNGRVKWFNNGYGFITMNEKGENDSEKDVFVHHTSICVETNQYKYLVQGEYVEFGIIPVEKEGTKYDFQATNVSGINGGKLMCETRREYKLEQDKYKSTETTGGDGINGNGIKRTYQNRELGQNGESGRGHSSFRGRGRGRGRGYRLV